MPDTSGPGDSGDAIQLAQALTRRARASRWLGSFGLVLAVVAGLGAAGAAVLVSGQLLGGLEVLPELPEMLAETSPVTLGLGAAVLMVLAAAMGTVGMQLVGRSRDLAVRSWMLQLGNPMIEANLQGHARRPREGEA